MFSTPAHGAVSSLAIFLLPLKILFLISSHRLHFSFKHSIIIKLSFISMSSSLYFLIPTLPIFFLLLLALIARPRPSKIPIKGRHVFISGGSSGIGLAIAHRAAAEGARVSILARDQSRLDLARDSIRLATGVDVVAYAADVRDYEAVTRAIEDSGPVDVLICNQGVFLPQELEKQGLDEIKLMVDVNLMGTFHLIKAALPGMRPRARGTSIPASIAIMSAQGGQVGVYGYTAYSASKFALRGLAEALQQEVVADKIYVSLIFPSDTETPGLVEEIRRRPEITKLITGTSGGMKADDVAKKALDGIKAGRFFIPCNLEGTMLTVATAGLSPQSSFAAAFLEISTASIMRFAALCIQWSWYSAIENWHSKNTSKRS